MNRTATLEERLLAGKVPLLPLTPEAGDRRYFRPRDPVERGWLLVRSPTPPPRATADWLAAHQVRVPRIGPEVPGAYLVEDLGDRHLLHDPSGPHYEGVLESWERFSSHDLPAEHPNAALRLDPPLFVRELDGFHRADLEGVRPLRLSPTGLRALRTEAARLAEEAASGPQRTQHRDFHSRNILLPPEGGIALIDHQDLRRGPLYYDLASLATDAYVDPSEAARARIQGTVIALGIRSSLSAAHADHLFRVCALQRVLKALGTFGRLLAAGRTDYAAPARRARKHARALARSLRSSYPLHAELLNEEPAP